MQNVIAHYWSEGAGAWNDRTFYSIGSVEQKERYPGGFLVDFAYYEDGLSTVIMFRDDEYLADSYIVYRGIKYRGFDGLQKLAVVLEREKIEKMLEEL